ncbi:MAG TPA: MFS transporter [Bryobacteraceae bacterium]|nr:MFS transporter [Bryobacteraceae bacterium]
MIEYLRARIRWVLIFWMFVVSAIAYLDRVNISIAGTTIAQEFHLNKVQLGWIFSAFVAGYALFQTPGGRIADRIGARATLMLGVIWWGVFTSLITFLPPGVGGMLAVMIGVRFCLGMGEAVVYPASNCVVAQWIPSSERGVANGFIFCGVGFGAGVTPPLIAYLMSHYGWRSSFWASALLGLLAGAIWYIVARDTPRQHPWITSEEAVYIASGLPQSSAKGGSWRAILSNPHVLAVTFSYFCYGYAAYIFFSWFFIYLKDVRNLDLKASAYYTMMPFLAMAVCSPLGGWISDRLTKSRGKRVGRCILAAVAIGFCAIFIALGTLAESAQMASVLLAGGAGALYISQSSFWSVSADIGGKSAGSVSGVMNMGGQLGGTLTASLTPLIAEHYGWTASFLVAAGLCAAGALAWLWVHPEGKLSDEAALAPVTSSRDQRL